MDHGSGLTRPVLISVKELGEAGLCGFAQRSLQPGLIFV